MKRHKKTYRNKKFNISGFLFTVLIILLLVYLILRNMTSVFDDFFAEETPVFEIETVEEAPVGLWVTPISEEEIDIGWSNEVPMDYYYIYFAYEETGFWDTVRDENNNKIKFDWSEDVIYKFTGITPGTKLYVKLQGVKGGLKSEYSSNVSAETFSGIKTILMVKPRYSRYKDENLEEIEPQYINLQLESEKENQVTDTDNWFEENSLELNEYLIPDDEESQGNLPVFIKREYKNQTLVKAIKDKDYIILIYGEDQFKGRYLLVLDKETGERLYSLDFKDYSYSTRYDIGRSDEVYQGIKWAQIEDNVLYISHSQNSYAKYSYYMTGYITAISLEDYHILWRTTGIVANSYNFTIYNDIIISAYGFTYEDDFLYLINKYSGGYYEQIKIKTAATYLITEGSKLFVRSYNTDYIFSITNKE